MSKEKPGSSPPHPCALGGTCRQDHKVLINHDSCYRGRIDARQCNHCGEIFGFEIIR